ncbi:hypothetical protein V2S66_03200 [Streptomyces sp. V4-01]|uniref:Uncharacterized protein n=1 Tax=Actinacidiphila polyblastidii TaxID=3110430 RepID=A0ABU7P595_9ACTN|nr:hypothetical protein [Streptomyces sp. V4-01]
MTDILFRGGNRDGLAQSFDGPAAVAMTFVPCDPASGIPIDSLAEKYERTGHAVRRGEKDYQLYTFVDPEQPSA